MGGGGGGGKVSEIRIIIIFMTVKGRTRGKLGGRDRDTDFKWI